MADPVKACGVDCTVKVILKVEPSSPSKLLCAVSLGSKNALILPVQLLSVAILMAQLPLAPKGVTSFTAPLSDRVHLDAFVKAVEASVQLAPTPLSAANFLLLF